ncbi:NADPH-dependent F420 reductase [Streptomyces erythrochromogenes]|uniref:NADPH-dependent F420 reductase n=1 Tax=Streptomyces erythrochromogenes TaxID=285574 RepID=UPI0036A4BC9D
MRIGILGTGSIATALGGVWVRAGHDIRVGSQDAAAAARTAHRIGGAAHGTVTEAAAHSSFVLLALQAEATCTVVAQLAPVLAGRLLLDCPTSVKPGESVVEPAEPDALPLAATASGAHLTRVFGLAHASIWGLDKPPFQGVPLSVPFTADTPEAVQLTTEFITGLGCTGLHCGKLSRTPLLEPSALFSFMARLQVRRGAPAPSITPLATRKRPAHSA